MSEAVIPILLLLQLTVYGGSFIFIYQNEKFRTDPFAHSAFLLAQLIYFFFLFYNPACRFWAGSQSLNHINYAPYVPEGLLIYLTGLTVFNGTYLLAALKLGPIIWPFSIRAIVPENVVRPRLMWVFIFAFAAMFGNLLLSGYTLTGLFNFSVRDTSQIIAGNTRYSILLETANQILISVLILAAVYKVPKWALLTAVLLCFCIFVFAGLRYRVIMVLIGMLTSYFITMPKNATHYRKAALVCLLFVIGLQYLTINRWAIARRQFSYLTFNLFQFNNQTLLTETNNSQTFFCMLRYNHLQNLGPDYGESMFKFVLIRALPKNLFENGKKPVAPLLQRLVPATNPPNPERGLPAYSNIDEYYLSFGWPGVVIGMALLAYLLARMPNYKQGLAAKAWQVLVTAFLFQLITRGYFPQQMELFVFLLLPLLAINAHYPIKPVQQPLV